MDAASGTNSKYNGYKTKGGCTNYNSLGIEMCQVVIPGKTIQDWPIHEKTIEQTLLQTVAWMKQYNIPIENVIRHYDVSGKWCPAPWRHNDWALWKQFKQRLSKMVGIEIKTEVVTDSTAKNNDANWAEYKAPAIAFKALEKGTNVTIRKGHQYWYIPEGNKKRQTSKDFAGNKDTILEVRDVSVSYSKKAYLLKDKKSWILEQDLVEATANAGQDFDTYVVKKGDSLWSISQAYKVKIDEIKNWNKLESNVIFSGQELFVQKPTHVLKDKKEEVQKVERPEDTKVVPNTEEVKEQPKDEGTSTPAVVLKPNQILTADGRILEFKDVTDEVKK